jgi:hypothetical protein
MTAHCCRMCGGCDLARVLVNWNWVGRRAALFGMQRRFLSSGPLSLPDLIITAKAAKVCG